MLTTKQRARAIFNSLYFGIMPSCVYEKTCHYKRNGENMEVWSYWQHLEVNLLIAKHLIMKTEHPSTHNFHKGKVKYFRWQYK